MFCRCRTVVILLALMFTSSVLCGCSSTGDISLKDHMKPTLTRERVDSITRKMVKPAKFMAPVDTGKPVLKEDPPLMVEQFDAKYHGVPGWVRTWGGSTEHEDQAKAVAVDTMGNVYVAGYFHGAGLFNTNPGGRYVPVESNGSADVFVSKFDSVGNFVWVRTWGGLWFDSAQDITVTGGSIYVTGQFQETVDFDPDPQEEDIREAADREDVFLTRLDTKGNYYWTRTWGGLKNDIGYSVASRRPARVYVVGTYGTRDDEDDIDFNPGRGLDLHRAVGGTDIFVNVFNADGQQLVSYSIGGSETDEAKAITIDKFGNTYVAGTFGSDSIDFSGGTNSSGLVQKDGGWLDVFLCKYGPRGEFLWVRTWGAGISDHGRDVAVDPDGKYVFICGSFRAAVDFSAGQVNNSTSIREATGLCGAFISKFSSDGIFQWVHTFDGSHVRMCRSLDITRDGQYIYATGLFHGNVNFNPEGTPHLFGSAGGNDTFIAKLHRNGGFEWVYVLGGTGEDTGWGVAADPIGGAYVVGKFSDNVNFAAFGPVRRTARGKTDAFLCSFPPNGIWGPTLEFGVIKDPKIIIDN